MTNHRMTDGLLRRCALALPFAILHLSFPIPASAHPSDISHLKVKVEPRRLEFRLTFNLYTLQQFHRIDTVQDGRISKQELEAGEQPLRDYIAGHVLLTINGEDSDLGEARRMERMWPVDSAGADVLAPDYAQRFVDFTYVKTLEPVLQDVWIGFTIFNETGSLHVVQGVFEQDGRPAEVSFSQNEPEYTWSTDYPETPAPPKEVVPRAERKVSIVAVGWGIAAIAGASLFFRKARRSFSQRLQTGPSE